MLKALFSNRLCKTMKLSVINAILTAASVATLCSNSVDGRSYIGRFVKTKTPTSLLNIKAKAQTCARVRSLCQRPLVAPKCGTAKPIKVFPNLPNNVAAIQNIAAKQCLNVENNGQHSGAKVIHLDCMDGVNYYFQFHKSTRADAYQIKAYNSNRCLTVGSLLRGHFQDVSMQTCNPLNPLQLFVLEGSGDRLRLRHYNSRNCIASRLGSTRRGSYYTLAPCSDKWSQFFFVDPKIKPNNFLINGGKYRSYRTSSIESHLYPFRV